MALEKERDVWKREAELQQDRADDNARKFSEAAKRVGELEAERAETGNDPRFQRLPLPETSGLICDADGVVPADAIRTLGEYDMLHTEAMDSLRAVLRSHEVLRARASAQSQPKEGVNDAT